MLLSEKENVQRSMCRMLYPSFNKQGNEYKKPYVPAHFCKRHTGKFRPEMREPDHLQGSVGKEWEMLQMAKG